MVNQRDIGRLLFVKCVLLTIGIQVACADAQTGPATPTPAFVLVDNGTRQDLSARGLHFQQSLAVDGRLDQPEYDRLVHAYRQCVNEGGAAFTEESGPTSHGTFHIVIHAPAGTEPLVHACTDEFWEPLGPLWSLGHQPSRQQIQAANVALGECLRRAGEDFPYENPSEDDFQRFHGGNILGESMLKCSQEVGRDHGMPGFAGG